MRRLLQGLQTIGLREGCILPEILKGGEITGMTTMRRAYMKHTCPYCDKLISLNMMGYHIRRCPKAKEIFRQEELDQLRQFCQLTC